MFPKLLETYTRLDCEYGLLTLQPCSATWAPDLVAYRSAVARLDQVGAPVSNHCRSAHQTTDGMSAYRNQGLDTHCQTLPTCAKPPGSGHGGGKKR